MSAYTVGFGESQIYTWNSERTQMWIDLSPIGASPYAPALVTPRENSGYPAIQQIYAQTRTVSDGIAGVQNDYLRINFTFLFPASPNPNGGIQINVFQDNATGYRLRGPFGLLSEPEQKQVDEHVQQILGSQGIRAIQPQNSDS